MKERVREEVRKYLFVSAWLFVCFGALLLYRAALTGGRVGHGVIVLAAVAKALILGKFLLLGEAAGAGTRLPAHKPWIRVAWRSVVLLLVLVVLTFVEELVVGFVHGRSAGGTLAELHARSMPELAAECVLLLLALVPLVAAAEVGRTLGRGALRRVLTAPATPSPDESPPR
jgi:hypothetical protein